MALLTAGFHGLLARQTVPEWRAVLDAVKELVHVGARPGGPRGCRWLPESPFPFVAVEPRVRAPTIVREANDPVGRIGRTQLGGTMTPGAATLLVAFRAVQVCGIQALTLIAPISRFDLLGPEPEDRDERTDERQRGADEHADL